MDYLSNKRSRQLIEDDEFDVSSNEDDSEAIPIATTFEELDYLDYGDQTYTCSKCGALMWYAERRRKNRRNSQPAFSLCCMNGKIELPLLQDPPQLLKDLLEANDLRGKHFAKKIRAFNMMFSFTSMGEKIDLSINTSRGPYVFRLHGQNYHRIDSLLPERDTTPKFLQLYIHDTDNEVTNRISAVSSRDNSNAIDADIVQNLKDMLDQHNPLTQVFRMARDRFQEDSSENVKLKLIATREKDPRRYNVPTTSEVAALIIGDMDTSYNARDIVVETQTGTLQRINELHPSYLPLQYPLLFPEGEDGYKTTIEFANSIEFQHLKRTRLSMRKFFAFRIQDRVNEATTLIHSRKLFQQFLVDAYTMIEAERLNYIRFNQTNLRADTYRNLGMEANSGNLGNVPIGKRIVLPSSFTGGSRYMTQNYMDAMALCKTFGYPDLFITFTCNPKWSEIVRKLQKDGLQPEDRPDILCRMFKLKLDQLIKDVKDKKIFGRVQAVVYIIEFQKRGLRHAHILLFMHRDDKFPTTSDIDKIISAEIPNKDDYPKLHEAVKNYMIHGPCGVLNTRSPCMQNNISSKHFPKKYQDRTIVDDDGYPVYKRKDDGVTVDKNGALLDNRFVVPYNKELLLEYGAHINVEWCNQSRSIKYLFQYINKGNDRVTATIRQNQDGGVEGNLEVVDEIKNYYDCRYISPREAVWRIFGFDIHYRTPPVERLSFHLPDEQNIIFNDEDEIEDVLNHSDVNESQFLAWMACNRASSDARRLTYVDFPSKFVWNRKLKRWTPRKRGFSFGRIHHVSIGSGEIYYLRMLLNIVKGPTSYDDIRNIDGIIHEANTLSMPILVWDETWTYLTDDILHRQRSILGIQDLQLNEEQIRNYGLIEVEKILNKNSSTLQMFSDMSFLNMSDEIDTQNKLIRDEISYDRSILQEEHTNYVSLLITEQQYVYNTVMSSVLSNHSGVYFLYGHGGTGKTFIWKILSSALRCKGDIVLTVASSGIASLLLHGGRTTHSRFAIPINFNEDSTCNIPTGSDLAELIIKTNLIIWDEALMVHKYCFEALDNSLRDIMTSSNQINVSLPFEGKVIVFGGDFAKYSQSFKKVIGKILFSLLSTLLIYGITAKY